VVYGDGSRPAVLDAAGIKAPKALALCLSNRDKSVEAARALRREFPGVAIYAAALDFE
jgi:voltage-gated potassium channel Kch